MTPALGFNAGGKAIVVGFTEQRIDAYAGSATLGHGCTAAIGSGEVDDLRQALLARILNPAHERGALSGAAPSAADHDEAAMRLTLRERAGRCPD